MITVDSIEITEFRGIRKQALELKGANFAVCGPNGTGKSGVVDALEFVLTGGVSRLSGEGRGDVSLKRHGPHVDIRRDPGKARVKATVTIPRLGKTFTVERNLQKPGDAMVVPQDPQILEVLRRVQQHPEIVLSRREIIRYVLATPGKRAEEVQALLHLDRVEQVRTVLQKIANACERQLPLHNRTVASAGEKMLEGLGLSEFTPASILGAVNVRRTALGLAPLRELTSSTSFREGMSLPTPAEPQRIPKAQALTDVAAAEEALKEVASPETAATVAQAVSELKQLASDPAFVSAAERDSFYKSGVGLIDDAVCPFCDTPWDMGALKRHIQEKICHLAYLSTRKEKAESTIAPLRDLLSKAGAALEPLVTYGTLAAPAMHMDAVRDYRATCAAAGEGLVRLLPLEKAIGFLANLTTVPEAALKCVSDLRSTVEALPDPTKQEAARDWVTVAEERLKVWRAAVDQQGSAKRDAEVTRRISDIYASTSDRVLSGIYTAVQEDFAALYASVHRDDERGFTARLTPSLGKLGFDVDFYGRGSFPPGAYHSEGHQDNMGLCLYLALMRHLHGTEFTLAVLDDILMSVDAGHRRAVCDLLKAEFPNTQFVMTTHDPVWLRHMQTERLIGESSAIEFGSWDVDHGPSCWEDRDVWTEVEGHLRANDVRAAAALLRHYLEYTSAELCDRLRARVEFRGDNRYQLGELLPAAIGTIGRLYRRAKDAAASWGQHETVRQIEARASEFHRLADATNAEQWQVNTAIHFNSWANLEPADFVVVVAAFRKLLAAFACPECHEYLRLSPDRGRPEAVRCGCGKSTVGLLRKGPGQ